MGHYRSEMGYEEEDARNARLRAERKARYQRGLEVQIARDGVAVVLSDLLDALAESRVYVGHHWEHWRDETPPTQKDTI